MLKIKYYYDGSLLLCEKDGAGKVQKVYINDGEGIIGMVRPIYNTSNTLTHYQRLYYMYDSLGSISVVTGENGIPIQNYTYSPYGSCLNTENDPVNNLRFVGRYGGYHDDDTGLTYFWHRWYSDEDGRWVSRDMIGVCGDINLFRYVKNSPLLLIDVTGYLYEDICDELQGNCMDKCHKEFNECYKENKCLKNLPIKEKKLKECFVVYYKKRDKCIEVRDKCKDSIGKPHQKIMVNPIYD